MNQVITVYQQRDLDLDLALHTWHQNVSLKNPVCDFRLIYKYKAAIFWELNLKQHHYLIF